MKHSMPSLKGFTNLALINLAGMNNELKRRGLSLYEVARRTGIGATTIEMYVRNRIIPSARDYNRLAKLFGWEKI